jgi:hypothetical protein
MKQLYLHAKNNEEGKVYSKTERNIGINTPELFELIMYAFIETNPSSYPRFFLFNFPRKNT